ncbi:MAG TPA: antibiotic biosynthesis monooxygenase [Planctomycetaceae bacterium]|nr:antibiotic biosynthesis monooxygenase [Planctomycetaceae bacterium]
MIARIWCGKTKAEHYETYTQFMRERALPDYSGVDGFVRLDFLRRLDGEYGIFQLITYWRDEDAIRSFAGDDIQIAKYYTEDQLYLLEFEEHVTHFDVFASV